jgi:uncharacterized protein YeaO (DUF488 family)
MYTTVAIKRVYEPYAVSDGYRVLVDRLWPRGLSKAKAHLDAWEKDVAPSDKLRLWYAHDPAKWPEFQKRYKQELRARKAKAVLETLVQRAETSHVTLVYSSRASNISNATVLAHLLNARVKRRRVRPN